MLNTRMSAQPLERDSLPAIRELGLMVERDSLPAIRELGLMLNLRGGGVVLFVSRGLGFDCVADSELCQYYVLRISLLHPPMKVVTFHVCSYVCYLATLSIQSVLV